MSEGRRDSDNRRGVLGCSGSPEKNPMMKNLSAERNPCINLFWGMWERVDESRVRRQEVNVANRESTKRGHACQRILAKDVQLSR